MTTRGRVAAGALLIALATAVGPPALAQDPDYPPTLRPSCDNIFLRGDVRVVDGRVVAAFRGRLTVTGGPAAIRANQRIIATVRSHPIFFGDTIAASDGSFSITNRLPSHIGPGVHEMIVDVGPGRARCVLPFTIEGARAGAILPRTGGGIASLVLWSMVLLVAGVSLVLYTRRHLRMDAALVGVRARVRPQFERLRRTPSVAHPSADLPRVDTAGVRLDRAEQRSKPSDDEDWPFFTPPDYPAR